MAVSDPKPQSITCDGTNRSGRRTARKSLIQSLRASPTTHRTLSVGRDRDVCLRSKASERDPCFFPAGREGAPASPIQSLRASLATHPSGGALAPLSDVSDPKPQSIDRDQGCACTVRVGHQVSDPKPQSIACDWPTGTPEFLSEVSLIHVLRASPATRQSKLSKIVTAYVRIRSLRASPATCDEPVPRSPDQADSARVSDPKPQSVACDESTSAVEVDP